MNRSSTHDIEIFQLISAIRQNLNRSALLACLSQLLFFLRTFAFRENLIMRINFACQQFLRQRLSFTWNRFKHPLVIRESEQRRHLMLAEKQYTKKKAQTKQQQIALTSRIDHVQEHEHDWYYSENGCRQLPRMGMHLTLLSTVLTIRHTAFIFIYESHIYISKIISPAVEIEI